MEDFFKNLFEYNYKTNSQLLAVFMANKDSVSDKSVQLFSHILNAHHIWNNRILGKEITFAVWQIHSINDFSSINEDNYKNSLQLLNNHQFNQTINYTTSTKILFINTVQDILFHVINHSTYHRGQIASDLKNSGISPIVSDYIFYKR